MPLPARPLVLATVRYTNYVAQAMGGNDTYLARRSRMASLTWRHVL